MLVQIASKPAIPHNAEPSDQSTAKIFVKKLSESFSLVVVIMVVAIPEGLPMMIGLSLAFSVMRMNDDRILVRQLDAPEKMGSVNEICCGKTGTITQADMKVRKFYCEQKMIQNNRKDTILNCELSDDTISRIKAAILYNCEARVEMDVTKFIPVGNPTEVGFLRFLQDADIPIHLWIQRKYGRIRAQVPFSPETKRSAIALEHPDKPGVVLVHIKGAPEVILNCCQRVISHEVGPDQEHPPMTQQELQRIEENVLEMASSALRVIAFATFEMPRGSWAKTYESGSGGGPSAVLEQRISRGKIPFAFLGIFGLKDPIRKNVNGFVQWGRNHGNLSLRMLSGDHVKTATAVALKCGILRQEEQRKDYTVMTGEQLRAAIGQTKNEINYDIMQKVEENLRVLARASSSDKELLIEGLKMCDKNVAVTGEGVND